jgi:hypothetical protein
MFFARRGPPASLREALRAGFRSTNQGSNHPGITVDPILPSSIATPAHERRISKGDGSGEDPQIRSFPQLTRALAANLGATIRQTHVSTVAGTAMELDQ